MYQIDPKTSTPNISLKYQPCINHQFSLSTKQSISSSSHPDPACLAIQNKVETIRVIGAFKGDDVMLVTNAKNVFIFKYTNLLMKKQRDKPILNLIGIKSEKFDQKFPNHNVKNWNFR